MELINPDPNLNDDLIEASVRVTRIVGQFAWEFENVDQVNIGQMFIHHRVYPVSGDGVNYFQRFLFELPDADTDFMWHHIEGVQPYIGNAPLSIQQQSTSMTAIATPMPGVASRDIVWPPTSDPVHGRRGHVDIKVDRRIDEGEGLLWKSEFSDTTGGGAGATLPWVNTTAGVWNARLYLWLRLLIKVDV